MTAIEVFVQNDGAVTKAYYAEMEKRGPAGRIAVALFRAQKRSTAAKRYRGGRYKRAAYDTKNWSLEQLCLLLHTHAPSLGITWGWKVDPAMQTSGDPHDQVLYVDLPFIADHWEEKMTAMGMREMHQVSFHSSTRYAGAEYCGEWDGEHSSQERILAFADQVMQQPPCSINPTSPRELNATENSARTGAGIVMAPSETAAPIRQQTEANSVNHEGSPPLPPELQPALRVARRRNGFAQDYKRITEELKRGGGRLAL